jgi:hypothetical protein
MPPDEQNWRIATTAERRDAHFPERWIHGAYHGLWERKAAGGIDEDCPYWLYLYNLTSGEVVELKHQGVQSRPPPLGKDGKFVGLS